MTVTECKLVAVRNVFKTKREQEHVLTYRIIMSEFSMWENIYEQALTASPDQLPLIYDIYPGSATAACTAVEIEQEFPGNKLIWKATATFGKLDDANEDNQEDPTQPDNPLERATLWRVEWDTVTETIEKDKDGNDILNSAGFQFDEVPTEDRRLLVITAEKNYATAGEIANIGSTYDRAVNAASFQGYGVRQVKFDGVACSEQQIENNVRFYQATFRFIIKPETWDRKILDRGFIYLDDDGNTKVAVDSDGQPVVDPILLDGNGHKLPDDEIGVTLTFQVNPLMDLNNIGL